MAEYGVAAAFPVAAKAATLGLFRTGLGTTRFALVIGLVQLARAETTALGALDCGQIQIDF
jgi:hypothetical protein